MAGLVVGHSPLLPWGEHPGPLVAGDDPVDGLFHLRRGDGRLASPGGQQRRFVHDAGQVGPGEPRRLARQPCEIHAGVEALASSVDLQDGEPAGSIGSVHHHLPVEAPPTQKSGIEHVRPVGGPEDHHAGEAVEAVHLDQQLVQGLVPLLLTAAGVGGAGASRGVQLVEEENGRCALANLSEQLPDTSSPDALVHLHELGAGGGEERYSGLSGDGSSQQRLPGPRRTDQQDAAGRLGPDLRKPLRVHQVVAHLPDFGHRFLATGYIGKGDRLTLGLAPRDLLGAALVGPGQQKRENEDAADEKGGDQVLGGGEDDPLEGLLVHLDTEILVDRRVEESLSRRIGGKGCPVLLASALEQHPAVFVEQERRGHISPLQASDERRVAHLVPPGLGEDGEEQSGVENEDGWDSQGEPEDGAAPRGSALRPFGQTGSSSRVDR